MARSATKRHLQSQSAKSRPLRNLHSRRSDPEPAPSPVPRQPGRAKGTRRQKESETPQPLRTLRSRGTNREPLPSASRHQPERTKSPKASRQSSNSDGANPRSHLQSPTPQIRYNLRPRGASGDAPPSAARDQPNRSQSGSKAGAPTTKQGGKPPGRRITGKRHTIQWHRQDREKLREFLVAKMTFEQIGARMKRTAASVKRYAHEHFRILGLARGLSRHWRPQEVRMLRRLLGAGMTHAEIAAKMRTRTKPAVDAYICRHINN